MIGDAIRRASRVRQVDVPQYVKALSTLPRIDYADTFFVDVGPAAERTAEQWAREILEGAPPATRTRLLAGWASIGLMIGGDRSGDRVLGWRVLRRTPDVVLLGADSRIGMPGELLITKDGETLVFATFLRFANPIVRVLWAAVKPPHVRTVSALLEEARRRTHP